MIRQKRPEAPDRDRETAVLLSLPLFRGIDSGGVERMRNGGCIYQRTAAKGQVILRAGDTVSDIGIVLSGSVNIEATDLWGGRSILSRVLKGHVFAEVYALSREPLMVDAVAAEETRLSFLSLDLLPGIPGGESLMAFIKENLLFISVQKNLALSSRIFCTAPKTIRGRLLIYLSSQAARTGSTAFQIPFNRQELADYLNLDRSALSKELGKMRDEGILEFHKNSFVLHGGAADGVLPP